MDEKTYSITLSDGTVLSDLGLNGDNYISETPVDPEVFVDNCSPIIISDGEVEELHENMSLVQVTKMGNKYWFVLRDISVTELEKIKMQSDIEYLAMMSDIEL